MQDYGKTEPVDGLIGVVMRALALAGLAFVGVGLALVALREGMPRSLMSNRGMTVAVPAIVALLSGVLAARLGIWIARALVASERQFVQWQRGVLAEILFTGMGAGLVILGNTPGVAMQLGPLGLFIALIGLGFVANPHAALFDGDRRRVTLSGVLYSSHRAFEKVRLEPLVVRTRGAAVADTWHVGLAGGGPTEQLSLPMPREEVHAVVAHIARRTGVPSRTTNG